MVATVDVVAHRPSQRPYPGAPGFVLTRCRVCDGRRWRVQLVGDEPVVCRVWRDAVAAGVVEGGELGPR